MASQLEAITEERNPEGNSVSPRAQSGFRDSLLAKTSRRYAVVDDIPGLPPCRLQSVTDAEQRRLAARRFGDDGELVDVEHTFADWAIATIIDEDGNPEFGDIDRDELAKIDSVIAQPLFDRIQRHCRLGQHRQTEEELRRKLKDVDLFFRLWLCDRWKIPSLAELGSRMESSDLDLWSVFFAETMSEDHGMDPEEYAAKLTGER